MLARRIGSRVCHTGVRRPAAAMALPATSAPSVSKASLPGQCGQVNGRSIHGHGWMSSAGGHGTEQRYGTTILSVRKGGKVALVGDGQVSQGNIVIKPNAVKVRRIGENNAMVGFAGTTADAMTLLERLEGKLEAHSNQLLRACVELAKDWRTEKYLRSLEAVLVVCDKHVSLEVTGNGDVLEPHDGVIAIGSGGAYARAAAVALMDTDMSAMEIAERAMKIAAEMCVMTNNNFTKDEMDAEEPPPELMGTPGEQTEERQ